MLLLVACRVVLQVDGALTDWTHPTAQIRQGADRVSAPAHLRAVIAGGPGFANAGSSQRHHQLTNSAPMAPGINGVRNESPP